MSDKINMALLTDFYEFTMSQGYFDFGMKDKEAVFDVFFRKVPDGGGYAIMAGLEELIKFFENLSFNDDDIEYLRSKNKFSEEFLSYLKNFRLECDIWSVKEGTPIFPHEPVMIVKGPVIQAQLIETMILLTINHQSLIATKANRIVRAAKGRAVMEFGSRRAQGRDAAIYGARAAYIAGCTGTACTISDKLYNIPAMGTMAHSWVQMFPTEYEAFAAYAKTYPWDCTLLIDTYNVLKSGLPNAIKVFKDVILPAGYRPKGVRIDSGDITYLSKEVRKELDANGFEDVKIVASNSLDEYVIKDLLNQGAKIDIFGVGERLITSKSEPVFGGVYKLSAVFEGDKEIPKIKISENVGKITNPCFKNLYRLYDNKTGKAVADVITLHKEEIEDSASYTIFDPEYIWKKQTLTDFTAEKLLHKVMEKGKLCYQLPDVCEIKAHCEKELSRLWDEVKRFENPQKYYVDLSEELWSIKQQLLHR